MKKNSKASQPQDEINGAGRGVHDHTHSFGDKNLGGDIGVSTTPLGDVLSAEKGLPLHIVV